MLAFSGLLLLLLLLLLSQKRGRRRRRGRGRWSFGLGGAGLVVVDEPVVATLVLVLGDDDLVDEAFVENAAARHCGAARRLAADGVDGFLVLGDGGRLLVADVSWLFRGGLVIARRRRQAHAFTGVSRAARVLVLLLVVVVVVGVEEDRVAVLLASFLTPSERRRLSFVRVRLVGVGDVVVLGELDLLDLVRLVFAFDCHKQKTSLNPQFCLEAEREREIKEMPTSDRVEHVVVQLFVELESGRTHLDLVVLFVLDQKVQRRISLMRKYVDERAGANKQFDNF